MNLESSFTLLREIGTLPLSDKEEIRFSIDVYRGFRYISVRKYVQEGDFSIPTKEGATLTPEIIRILVPRLLALPQQARELKLGTVGKFAKRPGICIVVNVCEIGNTRGIELRQWEQNKGYTQKGILLPLSQWAIIRQLFTDTLNALNEAPEIDF